MLSSFLDLRIPITLLVSSNYYCKKQALLTFHEHTGSSVLLIFLVFCVLVFWIFVFVFFLFFFFMFFAPNITSVSGLSILDCPFVFLLRLFYGK